MVHENVGASETGRAAREKILGAAARLFAERGYESTSLAEVAREANVSKALIFWHFDSKERLYLLALRKNLEPYHIDREEIAGLDEPQQIAQLIDAFYHFVNDNFSSVRFFMSLMLRGALPGRRGQDEEAHVDLQKINELYQSFRQSFAEIFARGQRRGVFAPQLDPEREAALLLVTLVGVLVQQFMLGESPENSKTLLEHYKQTLFARLQQRQVPRAKRT